MKHIGPIKVLIVDDSAIIRTILSRVLSEVDDIDVVGLAKDPYEARELIINYRPNVIILDIEMPRMDGITFLKKLQKNYPVPVIMCSGVAPANSHAALRSIELGAVDFVSKPAKGGSKALRQLSEDLVEKIRAAAIANPIRPDIPNLASTPSCQSIGVDPSQFLIALGASTGGTEAIKLLLSNVPEDFPPIAIVQHMPEGFTNSFAERLDQFCPMCVTEAVEGDRLMPGRVFIARGGTQMALGASKNPWRLHYGDHEPVNRHCPSVDVLFDSVAKRAGIQAIGILLTGMGDDGAKGLLNMRNAGAVTLGQDQKSSIVYGMPKVAADIGAVQHVASPAQIPRLIIQALQQMKKGKRPTLQPAR